MSISVSPLIHSTTRSVIQESIKTVKLDISSPENVTATVPKDVATRPRTIAISSTTESSDSLNATVKGIRLSYL